MVYAGSVTMIAKSVVGSFPPPRVLLAEDSTLIAMDIESILTNYGCEVLGPFASVGEALKAVDRERVDVAVIDFLLNDGSAEPLARVLDDQGIPYAICTGAGEAELTARYPYTPLLGKPYNPDDVCMVVNSLIASRLARVDTKP